MGSIKVRVVRLNIRETHAHQASTKLYITQLNSTQPHYLGTFFVIFPLHIIFSKRMPSVYQFFKNLCGCRWPVDAVRESMTSDKVGFGSM